MQEPPSSESVSPRAEPFDAQLAEIGGMRRVPRDGGSAGAIGVANTPQPTPQ